MHHSWSNPTGWLIGSGMIRVSAGFGVDLVGVAGQHGDVVGPLPGRRVTDRTLAAQAAQVPDRLHAALFQPVPETGLDGGQVFGPMAQQRRGHHGHIGPGQQHLDHVGGGVDPGAGGQRGRDLFVRIAIQRSGSRSSSEVDSTSWGVISKVSRSRSGW